MEAFPPHIQKGMWLPSSWTSADICLDFGVGGAEGISRFQLRTQWVFGHWWLEIQSWEDGMSKSLKASWTEISTTNAVVSYQTPRPMVRIYTLLSLYWKRSDAKLDIENHILFIVVRQQSLSAALHSQSVYLGVGLGGLFLPLVLQAGPRQ